MTSETRISELTDIFKNLADTAGGYERTRIMPNLEVIDVAPANLPANFIIIKDDEGFYIPALTVAGMTYTNGDLVNVLFVKGAEPIAFQHGSSGSGGYAIHISDEGVDQGNASTIDFVGAGVTAAVAAGIATITVAAGGGGWPAAGKAMINTTEYDTVQLAIDAMSAGDIIKVGQGTDSGGITPDLAGAIVGLSPVETIVTRSDNDTVTVSIDTPDNVTLKSLAVSHTGAGTSVACVQTNQDGILLDGVTVEKISGAPTNSTGVSIYGGSGDGTYLRNCKIKITTGTNKYGIYTSTAANVVVIEGGEINAATADIYIGHASSVVELRGVKLLGGGINNAANGTVRGWYFNASGSIVEVGTSDIFPQGSTNGLNARFERLFGDDKPATAINWQRNTFIVNDAANNTLGFNDTNTTPTADSYTPPSPFSKSNTGSVWFYILNHHLMINSLGGTVNLIWTSSTAKTLISFIAQIAPRATVTYFGEIRVWDVQSPGVSDHYWAIRFRNIPGSYPDWPWRVQLWSGQGTTFTESDGTMAQDSPWNPHDAQYCALLLGAGPRADFFVAGQLSQIDSADLYGTVADKPVNCKTMYFYIPGSYESASIDSIQIT